MKLQSVFLPFISELLLAVNLLVLSLVVLGRQFTISHNKAKLGKLFYILFIPAICLVFSQDGQGGRPNFDYDYHENLF